MKTYRLQSLGLLALTGVLALATVQRMTAQAVIPAETETWQLSAGDIIEILPLHDIPNARVAWVMLRDATQSQPEEFVEGGTVTVFRFRPIQPARYTLYGDIASEDGSMHIKRTFKFDVKARDVTSEETAEQSQSGTLVTTQPKIQSNGVVALASNMQMLRLVPHDLQFRGIALDTDTTVDANNDGDPANDVENSGTFFQSDATPLFVWFAKPELTSRTLKLTAVQEGSDDAQTQTITTLSFDEAKRTNALTSSVAVTVQQTDSGSTFTFVPALDEGFPADVPLIYRWNFGDGEESLETQPTHLYTANGTYTVTLQVRNLTNGAEIGTASAQLTVSSYVTPDVSSAASSVSSEPSEPSNSSGSSFPLGTILIGALILILSLGLGAGLIFLFSRLRRGSSLDQHLAKMEENIMKKEKEKMIETVTPMPIPTTATVSAPATPVASEAKPKNVDETATPTQQKLAEAERDAAAAKPTPAPAIQPDKAPDWLKKGLAADATTTQAPAPAQTPAPAPKPIQPKPAPAAAPQPAVTKPAPAPAVQPKPQTPPPAPKPAPAPLPPKPAEPKPAPAPAVPKPAEAPKPQAPQPAPANSPAQEAPKPQTPPLVVPPNATISPVPAPKPAATPQPAAQPKPAPTLQAQPTAQAPQQTPKPPVPPAPKPEAPKPAPAPAVPQPPAAPQPPKAPTPAPAPVVPPAPKPPVPPVASPAPVQPKPADAPKPAPQPIAPPVAAPVAPKPAEAPKPVEPPKAAEAPKPAPEVKDIPLSDEPIAIIRAESLNPPKQNPPQA